MKNKTRSFLLLVCLPVLMLVMLSPAYAITTTVKPSDAINGTSTDAYTATLDPTGATDDIYNLNITIPKGYILNLPLAGKTVGNYTMLNTTTGTNKVIINITSADPDTDKVNVIFSTDYGATYSTSSNQNISNMSIGASTLNITKPTSSTAGYFNIFLGGTAGPINPANNRVTLTLANGTLTNPNSVGTYTWVLAAKRDPADEVLLFTKSNDVRIAAGASSAVSIPVFNNTTPASASLALPNGSLTVNITTSAAGNVTNFAITLSNFTLGYEVNPATAGAAGRTKFMFFVVDAPALALSGIPFNATIRVNYSSILPLTISETDLTLFRFNATSLAWEPPVEGTLVVNQTTKIVSGNFTSLSTFAIMGAAAAAPPGVGVGVGGTGGGGVTTSEPFENIAKSERYDKSLIANTPVTYTFKAPEHGIYEISITGKENENDIALRVEALKGTSKLVTASPPGTVYKNLNVWAGTKKIKEAIIRFKVDNTWLDSNKVASSDIRMLKWDVDKWVQLETSETTKDSTSTYYEVRTDSFSVWAISSIKGVAVPTAVQTPAETVTTTVTPVKTIVPEAKPKTPGFEAIITIFAIALLVSFIKKRR